MENQYNDRERFLWRKINKAFGINRIKFELSKQEIQDIIELEAIPLFSRSFHYIDIISITDEDLIDGYNGRYYLNYPLEIFSVEQLFVKGTGSYGAGTYGAGNSNSTSVLDVQVNNMMSAVAGNPLTFQFHSPNAIEVFPKGFTHTNFLVEIATMHPKNLLTIKLGFMENFAKLVIGLIAEEILPMREEYGNMETTFGSIEVNIDRLKEMIEAKELVLETYKEKRLFSKKKKIYVG